SRMEILDFFTNYSSLTTNLAESDVSEVGEAGVLHFGHLFLDVLVEFYFDRVAREPVHVLDVSPRLRLLARHVPTTTAYDYLNSLPPSLSPSVTRSLHPS